MNASYANNQRCANKTIRYSRKRIAWKCENCNVFFFGSIHCVECRVSSIGLELSVSKMKTKKFPLATLLSWIKWLLFVVCSKTKRFSCRFIDILECREKRIDSYKCQYYIRIVPRDNISQIQQTKTGSFLNCSKHRTQKTIYVHRCVRSENGKIGARTFFYTFMEIDWCEKKSKQTKRWTRATKQTEETKEKKNEQQNHPFSFAFSHIGQ